MASQAVKVRSILLSTTILLKGCDDARSTHNPAAPQGTQTRMTLKLVDSLSVAAKTTAITVDAIDLQGFGISRDKKFLPMTNPCSFPIVPEPHRLRNLTKSGRWLY